MHPEALLSVLADGRCHSGEALAQQFGVTRAAIWKQVAKLERWGLGLEAVPGSGYRLAEPLDLLDEQALSAALAPSAARLIERLEVFAETDSTNRYLLARPPAPGRMSVCLAEFQRAGRGRRGRAWIAPFASGLCLSAGWRFLETPPELPALTLAVGVVVRRVLVRCAGIAIELKWPNDLVWDERKLGGILVELVAEAQGGCHVVAGLGLNVAVPPGRLAGVSDWSRGAVDLREALGGPPPARTALAAALVENFAELFVSYARTGFGPYRAEFEAADHLRGRRITVTDAAGGLEGTARGLEPDGALRVELGGGTGRYARVISGDVSVRPAP